MVSVASDRVRITEDAGFDPPEAGLENQHEHLKFADEIVIGPDGKYIYLWVSNESEDTKVWFDDFTVTHSSLFVAQATDYGVWGDVIREQKRDLLERYRFGYQGQFAEKDEETGWNHFELRAYDPIIGRWTVVDPMRQYWSPYVGIGNDPGNLVDPTGGCTDGNGNPIPCPDGIPENGNIDLIILNEVVIKPDLVNGPVTPIRTTGYYGPPKDFQAAQDRAAFQAAMVVLVTAEFIKSQFEGENHGADGVIAMSPPLFGSPSKAAKVFKDWNKARNAAIKWLEARGFKAEQKVLGKFGALKGKPIGMKTANGKVGFRVEHDARHGGHINAWAGKEKITFEVENVSEATIQQLQKLYK